ncbi:MAG: 2OG-Fe(II) oxygenase [Candidatus Nanopelagicales bacterium]
MPESVDLVTFVENRCGWYEGQAAESRNKKVGYENIRRAKSFPFHPELEDESQAAWHRLIDDRLKKCQDDYINYYAIDILEGHNSGYQVVSYSEGDYFSEHTDEIPEEPRRISGVYYINDNYSGGELFFTQFNIKIKPKAMDYIIFPSIWAYTHIAEKVTQGTKNAIVHFMA